MKKCLHTVSVILALLSVAGCKAPEHNHRFQPLDEGRFWLYAIEKTTTDANEHLRHGLRVTDRITTADAITAILEDLTGKISIYKRRERGLFLTSNMENPPIESTNGTNGEYMVLPPEPTVGDAWDSVSSTQALESSSAPWEKLFKISANLNVKNQITSVKASTTTSAGHFADCLLVTSFGKAQFYLGDYLGETVIEQNRQAWYAENVGLVRLEVREKTDSAVIKEGLFVMQLVMYSK
jgi:hypothetical protein